MLDRPFVGSEAIARRFFVSTSYGPRFRALFPDVYAPKDAELTLHQQAKAGGSGPIDEVSSRG